MTSSICVTGFMLELNELIRNEEPNKKILEPKINKLFQEFCEEVLIIKHHKELIEEAREYYLAALENIDIVLEKLRTHTLQDIGGRFS